MLTFCVFPPVSVNLCVFPPVSVNLCVFPPVSVNLCVFPPVSVNLCVFPPVSANLCGVFSSVPAHLQAEVPADGSFGRTEHSRHNLWQEEQNPCLLPLMVED